MSKPKSSKTATFIWYGALFAGGYVGGAYLMRRAQKPDMPPDLAALIETLNATAQADARAAEAYTTRLMRVTAYCPCEKCCAGSADGITASGKPVTYNGGKFAAGPKDLPFGTMVNVPGYGRVEIIDRGGVINGDRLDVFFPTHQEALKWGVQHLEVRVER